MTYTESDASEALKTFVINLWDENDYSEFPLFGNNGPRPDLDKLDRVANWEIEFTKSDPVTIGQGPVDRTWGYIEFHVGTREGLGTKKIREVKGAIKLAMKSKHIDRVITMIPSPGAPRPAKGWVFEVLYVPFYFDSSPIGNCA